MEEPRQYLAAGLSVLPADRAAKHPSVASWKEFQGRLPTEAEVDSWFRASGDAVCVVCGKVSGNLECIDFDNRGELFPKWAEALPQGLFDGIGPGVVFQESVADGCDPEIIFPIRLDVDEITAESAVEDLPEMSPLAAGQRLFRSDPQMPGPVLEQRIDARKTADMFRMARMDIHPVKSVAVGPDPQVFPVQQQRVNVQETLPGIDLYRFAPSRPGIVQKQSAVVGPHPNAAVRIFTETRNDPSPEIAAGTSMERESGRVRTTVIHTPEIGPHPQTAFPVLQDIIDKIIGQAAVSARTVAQQDGPSLPRQGEQPVVAAKEQPSGFHFPHNMNPALEGVASRHCQETPHPGCFPVQMENARIPAGEPDPAGVVRAHREDPVGAVPRRIGHLNGRKTVLSGIETIQKTVRSHRPYIAAAGSEHIRNIIFPKGIMMQGAICYGISIQSVPQRRRPYFFLFGINGYGTDVSLVQQVPEFFLLFIKGVEPALSTQPKPSSGIFFNTVYTQAAGLIYIFRAEYPDGVRVVHGQPFERPQPDGSLPVLMTGINGIGRKSVLPGKLPELQLLAGERQGCRHPDDKKANQLSHNVSAILPEDRKM